MITAALVGNPNCGKTTIFNKLTGAVQKTGNWPGVTVERKQGFLRGAPKDDILVVDLPGIYSLSPYSPDEVVSRDFLIGDSENRPDVAICIIDASNLERGLYLLTQVADLRIPMVVVLNMMDVAEKIGMRVKADALSEILSCPVVETVGTKGQGTSAIGEAVQSAYEERTVPRTISYGSAIDDCIERLIPIIKETVRDDLLRWVSLKIIEGDSMVMAELDESTAASARSVVEELEQKVSDDGMQIIATARYKAGEAIRDGCVEHTESVDESERISERIDRILLNKYLAWPIFALVMFTVYLVSVQTVGLAISDYINDELVVWVQDHAAEAMDSAGVDTVVADMMLTGVIGGVGAVIGFIPLIALLFAFLVFLEECGYMVRVAYMLDRVFTYFGLSGKAIIPAVIGIGCSVPAIMGTRVIEDESNRNVSIICTSFMPCSAKLPIITLIVGAFFGASALVITSLYLFGIVMILISGLFLKKFRGFIGRPSPFVMELPVYHMPTVRNVLFGVKEKSWSFIKNAGTIILLSAVLIWALSSFTFTGEYLGDSATTDSILSAIGKALCWIFVPLGFGGSETWELTVASFTGIAAKENLLATLAVLLDSAVGIDGLPTMEVLTEYLAVTAYPEAVAMSFLIFNLICAPCIASIAAIYRELHSHRKLLLALLYQCATAYGVAGIFYQGYVLLHGEVGLGVLWLILFIAVPVYVILSKRPFGFITGGKEEVQE